jgi:hypothetical protein
MRRHAQRRRAVSGARPDRLRVFAVALVLLVGVEVLAGCGGDGDERAPRPADARGPYLTLTEVESVLERGPLGLVRTGGGEPSSIEDVSAPLVESARYASQSGRQFDVFVFASERDARRAMPAVARHDEEASSAVRAANVVALFPKRFNQIDAYRAAADAMRKLRIACTPGGAEGDDRLRRLCFSSDGGIPPAGEGVERGEAAGTERPIVVDGLRYDPSIARRLNPHIEPDSALLSGRRPSDAKQWFGVFVRVCNDTDVARTSSSRLALVSGLGDRLRPSDALPDGPFVYTPRAIEPGTCIPHTGSVAARASDGLLVPFEVGDDFLEDRPIALEVTGDDGRRKRVVVDV